MRQEAHYKERQVTIKHASEYCLVSNVTIRRWIKDGKLSAIRLPSGHHRITTAGFRDFLERYNMPIKEGLFESEYGK